MNLKKGVLTALQAAGAEYYSGELLAKQFGVSRAAVWKAVKGLEKEGYQIEALTNRGYRLSAGQDLIRPEVIAPLLQADAQVLYYPVVDSTNTQAKRLLAAGKTGTLLLVAEEQTAGRGRQGKSFYSPPMTGIYMTLVTHPQAKLQSAVAITTAAAVAVCKAVEKLTDQRPQIKWVNDVYLNGKKICGILTEAVTDFESGTVDSVLIGIGMNIRTVAFPDSVENGASLQSNVRRADFIACIANTLLAMMGASYDSFIEDYRSRSMLIGRPIRFIQDGIATPATAVAIDACGGLVVCLEDGSQTTLRSGEISIRPQEKA